MGTPAPLTTCPETVRRSPGSPGGRSASTGTAGAAGPAADTMRSAQARTARPDIGIPRLPDTRVWRSAWGGDGAKLATRNARRGRVSNGRLVAMARPSGEAVADTGSNGPQRVRRATRRQDRPRHATGPHADGTQAALPILERPVNDDLTDSWRFD